MYGLDGPSVSDILAQSTALTWQKLCVYICASFFFFGVNFGESACKICWTCEETERRENTRIYIYSLKGRKLEIGFFLCFVES